MPLARVGLVVVAMMLGGSTAHADDCATAVVRPRRCDKPPPRLNFVLLGKPTAYNERFVRRVRLRNDSVAECFIKHGGTQADLEFSIDRGDDTALVRAWAAPPPLEKCLERDFYQPFPPAPRRKTIRVRVIVPRRP